MKRRFLALLLALALLLSLVACTSSDPTESSTTEPTETTTEPTTTEPPPPTAHELLAQQLGALLASDAVTLSVDVKEEHKVWNETFTQELESEIIYENLQSDMIAELDATVYYNDNNYYNYTEFFIDGHTYATFDGAKHQEESTAEEFLARQYPICLFDAENFAEGSIEEDSYGTTLTFTEASALEGWVAPEYAELVSAEATVLYGEDGIQEMTYTATFTQGAAEVTLTAESRLLIDCIPVLKAEVPEDPESYLPLSDVEIPRIIERAYENLLHSQTRSVERMRTVTSQAAGYACMYSTNLSEYGEDGDYLAKREQNLVEVTSAGQQSYTLEEIYRDGKYRITLDGESEEQNVTATLVRNAMEGDFTDNFIWGEWVTEAEMSAVGEGLLIEFGSEDKDCQDYMKQMVLDAIFGGEDPISELASDYEAKKVKGYLGVDPDTWLPSAYSVEFVGRHTVEGAPYELSQELYAGFTAADPTAYEDITEEALPEPEPEEKASPLFYHVTGKNGEEMWLLGTIHIGDERTAYLPQEIYAAFDAADALAVEFDLNAYEKRLDEDKEYRSKISELYLYEDKSSIDAHLEDELFLEALKHMKYSGNYTPDLERMNAAVWENLIGNSHLYAYRKLFTGKGVDRRLLERAEEQGKEILDIESGEKQLGIRSGFSDELQSFLLKETMETKRSKYIQEVRELYELWCAGDEAALIETVREDADLEDASEEEKKLYEEYKTAINTNRDVEMVKIAKEYLESGKVIFYAVGLAHLLEENGLVDSLRAAGYSVELVSYSK